MVAYLFSTHPCQTVLHTATHWNTLQATRMAGTCPHGFKTRTLVDIKGTQIHNPNLLNNVILRHASLTCPCRVVASLHRRRRRACGPSSSLRVRCRNASRQRCLSACSETAHGPVTRTSNSMMTSINEHFSNFRKDAFRNFWNERI